MNGLLRQLRLMPPLVGQTFYSKRGMSDHPDFIFDEFKPFAVDFHDVKEVEAYDRRQGTTEEEKRHLIAKLGVGSTDHVVDFGCGTWALAIQAAFVCERVVAVDVSEAMLSFAEARAQEMGVTNIEFIHAGFLTYNHVGRSVDFILTDSALHHLPDLWKVAAIQRMSRILKPNGILFLADAVYSFEPEHYQDACSNWIADAGKQDGSGFTPENFAGHIRDEYSTYSWILEAILNRARFEILEARYLSPIRANYTCRKS